LERCLPTEKQVEDCCKGVVHCDLLTFEES